MNPCSIKGAGVEPSDERALPTIEQVYELAAAVQPQFRVLLLLAAFGGLRRGELLALTRRDVDLLNRTVSVRVQRQETKGGGHLVSARRPTPGGGPLRSRPGSGPSSKPTSSVGWRPNPMRRCRWCARRSRTRRRVAADWTRARRSLGLEGVRLHDLRHVAGTIAAATGASTKELTHRLGHASAPAALRYQHATEKRDEAIANGIDQILRAAQPDVDEQSNVLGFRDGAIDA